MLIDIKQVFMLIDIKQVFMLIENRYKIMYFILFYISN